MSILPLIGFFFFNVFQNVAIWGEVCVCVFGEGVTWWVGEDEVEDREGRKG